MGSTGIPFIETLSQVTDQAWITTGRPDKSCNLHKILRGDLQAMELFVGCWEQEVVNRISGSAIDTGTVTL